MKKRNRLPFEEVVERYLHPYYREHGHVEVPQTYRAEDGYPLGLWVASRRQEQRKGALPPERVQPLEELGMVWQIRKASRDRADYSTRSNLPWWQAYERYAVPFHAEYRHLRVPRSYRAPDGYHLGSWVNNQRYQRDHPTLPLSQDQVQALDRIGMEWRLRPKSALLERAREYHQEHGHINVPESYTTADGYPLGRNIGKARQRRRIGEISADLEQALEEMGIDWNPRGPYATRFGGCNVPGCRSRHKQRGLCSLHSAQLATHYTPVPVTGVASCSVPECDELDGGKGWCPVHQQEIEAGHGRSAYRNRNLGCEGRCQVCRADHIRERTQARRRQIRREVLSWEGQRELIALLWEGNHLDHACQQVGLSASRMWALARSLPGLTEAVDAALMAMRPDGVEHGTEWTYRVKRCRCPECRQAKSRGR